MGNTTSNELPTLNAVRMLAIIGTHPKGFFEAMKELEPYIIVRVSSTRLEINLKSSRVNLERLGATFKRLNLLGYHPEAHSNIYTMPNGKPVISLNNITIDLKKRTIQKISGYMRIEH